MRDEEKDRLEESLTEVLKSDLSNEDKLATIALGYSLNCLSVSVTGRIVKKENDFIIVIETDEGEVKVDINDGITDTSFFKVGDAVISLPLQGAYLDMEERSFVFLFKPPSS